MTDSPGPEPPPLTVTAATAPDREWAARVMADTEPWLTLGRGLEQCRAACHRSDLEVRIARAGDIPCAFALVHPRGLAGSPYLASLAVASAFRGRGVGAALLAHCEQRAAASSRHFFLCVSSFNTRARAFYERLGYRQVGELPEYIIAGASEILMYKRLARG